MSTLVQQMITREMAQEMDLHDPISTYRERFEIENDCLYMDGNSLGRPLLETTKLVAETVSLWKRKLIIGWREWIHLPRRLGDIIATSVLEANAGEVIVGDSTSINLYKAASAAISAQVGRKNLITTNDNFPTDLYVLQSLAQQHSLNLKIISVDTVDGLSADQLKNTIDKNTALVCLSHVAYRSGALLDMVEITNIVHSVGALILWDVSHSAGSVKVPLESSGADLAVGCTYKYLNGGPGSPSFVYVRSSLHTKINQPLWGWFGHKNQFNMSSDFVEADGIESFLVGAPAILSTIAIEPGIALIAEIGIDRLNEKGKKMTALLIDLTDQWLGPYGFEIVSPKDCERRGSHVTLRHKDAKEIVKALISKNVIPDYRPSDMVRFGPAPIYTRFVDVWDALNILRKLCEEKQGDFSSAGANRFN